MNNEIIQKNEKQAEKIVQDLYEKFRTSNFLITPPIKGQYNYNFQIKQINSTVNVIVYFGKKGTKIVLQGNQNSKLYQEISQKLNSISENELFTQNEKENHSLEPEAYIGVDESGKGDFFGPLVIAGFYLQPEVKKDLISLGVQDSKELTDEKVAQIAVILKEKFKDNLSIVQIYPKKYNELYEKIGNLNSLLAWGHSRCIENILLKHKVPIAICDKFGNENYIKNALMKEGKQIELIQTPKAERYLGVAAASILARNAFIEWMKKTGEKLGIEIPKGASSKVKETAKIIVEKFGKEALNEYVKVHFKTYKEI